MLKKYKWTMILTTLVTLSPILFGIYFWNQLPEKMATHFNGANVANGWSGKVFAVFGLPLLMGVLEWVCLAGTMMDPKKKNINPKVIKLMLWIIPMTSVVCAICIYGANLGMNIDIGIYINILMGVILIFTGNYMPKMKQNYSVGIKISWTLESEENWNRTHRLASWLYILGGIIFLINAYFRSEVVLFTVIIVLFAVPMAYSYVLYKKGIKK